MIGALTRWIMSVDVLRIYEMTVSTEFKESNLKVESTIDMVGTLLQAQPPRLEKHHPVSNFDSEK